MNKSMEFLVLSRDKIRDYITTKRHILIQIYCHNDYPEPIKDLSSRVDTLQLQFDDWNNSQRTKLEGIYKNSQKLSEMIFFNDNHAKDIIQFVKKYLDKIELVVVQCDAGISRSAAVAAALSKCINDTDEYFFKNYLPNSLVYSIIMGNWNEWRIK